MLLKVNICILYIKMTRRVQQRFIFECNNVIIVTILLIIITQIINKLMKTDSELRG